MKNTLALAFFIVVILASTAQTFADESAGIDDVSTARRVAEAVEGLAE